MYGAEEFKFEAMDDDDEKRYGFNQTGLVSGLEQAFTISNYQMEGSIKYIKLLTVKNNKFWIVTKNNQLFTMKLGGLPEEVTTQKLNGADITNVIADEKGIHAVILVKNDKLYYLSNGNTHKIISFNSPEEITAYTIFVPTVNNADDRFFEVVLGTNFGSIYYGKLYIEKKGNLKVDISVNEILEIIPKSKIFDIKIFNSEHRRCIAAITKTSMHQFWGEIDMAIPDILVMNNQNPKRLRESIIDDVNYDKSKINMEELPASFRPTLSAIEGIDETTKSIGWQSMSGFYFIDLSKYERDDELITRDKIVEFQYPQNQGTRYGSSTDYPVSTIVTEWHVIFLFQFSICIFSKITREMVYNSKIGGESEMLGL